MRALIITIAFLSIFLSTTRQTKAQPCPGNGLMSATFNVATATGNGAYTMQFVATGMFCGGVPSGAATGCIQGTAGGPVFFRASWPNTAARTGDPAGGCVFTCPLGTCRVGQDGLPVELLDFSIDEAATTQATETDETTEDRGEHTDHAP